LYFMSENTDFFFQESFFLSRFRRHFEFFAWQHFFSSE
jgi:hypothetical protein